MTVTMQLARVLPFLLVIAVGCGGRQEQAPRTTPPDSVEPKRPDTLPAPAPAPPQSQAGTDSIGIRGTELTRTDSAAGGWHGYIYREFSVAVREDTAGGVGEEIRVAIHRPEEESSGALARAVASPDFVVPNDDANYFFGLSAGKVFVDQGTGPEPRGLAVYDIRSKKKVYAGTYSFPINMIDSNRLEFFKEIDAKPPGVDCPEQAEWTAGGLGVAYERRVKVDLTSGAESPTEEVRCAPRQ
jgi:hypothetical protein